MGTVLEELVVKLQLENQQYKKRLKDSAKATKTSTKRMAKAVAALGAKFLAFAAVVVLVRKAIRVLQKRFADIDALAKTARFLGITTEALAGLQHLGDLTGVSMGNLQTAMMRMTRAIGEAATGAKEYLEPFERIGIDVKELLRLAPEKQMARIAEGIAKLGTQTEQGAVAMEFFGRSGMRMLNLLRQGEKGFTDAEKEARKFGIALSQLDAQKIEDANDAITRMSASMKGAVTDIAIAFAPFVEKTAKRITDAITLMREGIIATRIEAEVTRLVGIFGPEAEASIRKQLRAQQELREERAKTKREGADEGGAAVPGAPTTEQLEEGIDQLKVFWHKVKNFTKKAHADIMEGTSEHEKQKTEIAKQEAFMRRQATLGAASSMITSLATIMDDGSRKAFKRSKDFALASAAVNTGAAIMQALGNADPWTGAALATAAALKGAAQIAMIQRTQYGGGGGGAAGGGGAGAGAGAAAPGPRPIDVSIGLQGERFGPAAVRELIGAIDEQLGDGVTMRSITVS